MSNLAIVSTPFVLLDLYGVTVTYSEMGKQKGGGAVLWHEGKSYSAAILYTGQCTWGQKKYDFFIKEDVQMTGIS